MGLRIIDIALDGVIQFQQSNDRMECIIHDVTEDYGEVMVAASDPRICAREDVELSILLPTERSPVKCTGRIVWHSGDERQLKKQTRHLARVFINDLSRMERRRLDLFVAQKKAFIGCGSGVGSAL